MNDKCAALQNEMIDIIYKEANMTPEQEAHLKGCEQCSKAWGECNALHKAIDAADADTGKEIFAVSKAFYMADKIQTRRNKIEALGFGVLAAMLLLLVCIFAATRGNLRYLFYFQAAMYLILPLTLIVFAMAGRKKESESHE